MSELKSAWEIAQEKANKLGKLSAEELQRQREEECRQIGQGVAQRYLDNPESLSLDIELNKHPEEERGLIRKAVASHLIQALDLSSWSGISRGPAERDGGAKGNNRSGGVYLRLEKITQGITSLEPESRAIAERVSQLFQEYEEVTGEEKCAIERKGREILHQLRISGTAVGDINMEATPQWQQTRQRLSKPFEPRLENLKQELITVL